MQEPIKIKVWTLIGQFVFMLAAFALALFVPAGTAAWPAGWLFVVLFFGFALAVTLWLFRHNPGLLQERMTGFSAAQNGWDLALLALAGVLFVAWLIVMPLDAVRFHRSHVPAWLSVAGAGLLLASLWLIFLTFRENSYLSPVVRIQKERGQTVISTGPYRLVRHPMYSGFVLFVLGTTLMLGSWYGLPLAALMSGVVARRAVLEERTLRRELAGYDAYMARVRYRLLPGVW